MYFYLANLFKNNVHGDFGLIFFLSVYLSIPKSLDIFSGSNFSQMLRPIFLKGFIIWGVIILENLDS